jgi:hypothetical protein
VLGQVQIQQGKDLRERKDCKDYKAILGHVVLKAILEILVLAGTREKLVRKAILDHVELRVTKAIQVPLVQLDLLVLMVLKDHKDNVVSEEFLARLEHKDRKATPALLAQKDHKDHKDCVD